MATTHPITHRQMRATEIWVHSGCKSKARALREAGYGKSIVRHPERVFNSPSVLEELEKKGLDRYGMRTEPKAVEFGEFVSPETQQIDFSKIPLEQMQDLKEKLQALDMPRNEERHSYVSTEEGVDILNGSLVQSKKPNDMSSFSAM